MPTRTSFSTPVAIAILAALLLSGLLGVSQAGASTLYACVKKKGGTARFVNARTNCRRGETKLAWNTQGVPGRNGSNGKNGAAGKNGTIRFTLTNSGNVAASGTADLTVLFATDAAGDDPTNVETVPVKVSLKTGQKKTFSVHYKAPALSGQSVFADLNLDVASLGDTTVSDGIAVAASAVQIS